MISFTVQSFIAGFHTFFLLFLSSVLILPLFPTSSPSPHEAEHLTVGGRSPYARSRARLADLWRLADSLTMGTACGGGARPRWWSSALVQWSSLDETRKASQWEFHAVSHVMEMPPIRFVGMKCFPSLSFSFHAIC